MAECSLLATKPPAYLYALLLLMSLLTVGALADPSLASDTKPFQGIREAGGQNTLHPFRQPNKSISTLIRHRYVRAVNGQLGVWDMVQLIAFCSLIGAIGFWQKRRATQRGNPAEAGSSGLKRVNRSMLDEHSNIDLGE